MNTLEVKRIIQEDAETALCDALCDVALIVGGDAGEFRDKLEEALGKAQLHYDAEHNGDSDGAPVVIVTDTGEERYLADSPAEELSLYAAAFRRATMNDREQFFYDHAGWSHDPKRETSEQGRERCAHELAVAEELLLSSEELFIVWSVDDESTEEQTLYSCLLCRDTDGEPDLTRGYDPSDGAFERPGVIVAALGGIELEDHPTYRPYKRVVQAELMQELETRRESMTVRGEN